MNEPNPPLVVSLYSSSDHSAVADAMRLDAFVRGEQPWARTLELNRVRPEATLLPPGVTPDRCSQSRGCTTVLAHGDGWTLHTFRTFEAFARVTVTARTGALLRWVVERVTRDAVEPAPEDDSTIEMGFWHLSGCGATRRPRDVTVAAWPEVRRNYSRRVAAALGRLMTIEPDGLSGRLLLLHGPPGTGKTSTLRSLAHAWRRWCQVDYVLDPERLLGDPSYLMDVAVGHDDDDIDDDDQRRWRLLVLEDCDELIRGDAKHSTGQSLARLLNLTDGLLGHGLRLLVAITTNEPLARLHPAVIRPGRCIAQIEVGRLTLAEARAWLGRAAPIDAAGATLAELFALRGELTTVEEVEPAAAGGGYL